MGSAARCPDACCCIWAPGGWHHLGSSICPVDSCMWGYLTFFLSSSSWAQSNIFRLTASLLCVESACSAMRIAALSLLATCCLCAGVSRSAKGQLAGSSKARRARVLSSSCSTVLQKNCSYRTNYTRTICIPILLPSLSQVLCSILQGLLYLLFPDQLYQVLLLQVEQKVPD